MKLKHIVLWVHFGAMALSLPSLLLRNILHIENQRMYPNRNMQLNLLEVSLSEDKH